MKRLSTFTALILMVVSGCTESGGFGLPGSPAWRMSTTIEEQSAYWQSVCESYGFQSDTPEMAQCIQTENNSSRDRNASVVLSPQPTSTITNCNRIGNNLNCVTF